MDQSREINIQIDVLQVEGVALADAGRFQRAVEHELGRLVREQGLSSSRNNARSLVSIDLERDDGQHAPGSASHARAVAGAIYRGLVR
jgi:hypothetical protein